MKLSPQRLPLHSRKRQEKFQSQQQHDKSIRRYSSPQSSQRQKQQPKSKNRKRVLFLCRTILLLITVAFFYGYVTIFSRARDGNRLWPSPKSSLPVVKNKKHSLREIQRSPNTDMTLLEEGEKEKEPVMQKQQQQKTRKQPESFLSKEENDEENDDENDDFGEPDPTKELESADKAVQNALKENDDDGEPVPTAESESVDKDVEENNEENDDDDDAEELPDPALDGLIMKATSTSETVNHHMVFSTDCSPYQRWQSYFLFYHAHKVNQPGKITRIASGCSDEEAEDELEWHTQFISKQMSSEYGIHLTPHFSNVKDKSGQETNKKYLFFNKPFGLLHWMEHDPDMGFKSSTDTDEEKTRTRDDTIVILIDPDMVLNSPITRDFPLDSARHLALGSLSSSEGRPTRVAHGQPFAQIFGFGIGWQKLNLPKVANDPSTPAANVTAQDALAHYPVGPPYLATARDMYRIAVKWVEFVPRVYEQHPHLMAEMFAFCIAAAHVELPFQVMNSLMISDTLVASSEGWSLFEKGVTDDHMCGFATEKAKGLLVVEGEKTLHLPGVVHFCQRYMLEKWFYGKRRVPKDFFSCDKPLLMKPPSNLATLYDFRIPPPSGGHPSGGAKKLLSSRQIRRETFMLCFMIQAMNDASTFYKEQNCDNPILEYKMELWKE